MTDDQALLRAMLAAPEDAMPRLVYADWLEERGDPRAALLRTEWDIPLLGWNPDSEMLGPAVDRDWLAAVSTLGRPFRPFCFWNNTGPRPFGEWELPFAERLGNRGAVLTFESAFRADAAWQPGLHQDLSSLCQLPLGQGEYGAASCPIHPFVCELDAADQPLTGAVVLRALKASQFLSHHIASLDVTTIPNPGYHPDMYNDQAHTDPAGQGLFPRPADIPENPGEWGDDGLTERDAVHQSLRGAVADGRLWYVLLHSRVGVPSDGLRAPWVVLFAVGRSLRGRHLIGVISHQLCHNFCD